MSPENHQKDGYLYKRIVNQSSKTTVTRRLHEISWNSVKGLHSPNESYIKFIETIVQIYDYCFSKTKFNVKHN